MPSKLNSEGIPMTIVCLDMEGVLTQENWIAFAGKVGRTDFKRMTRG